ncbi:MAG: hypothetical protein LBH16_04885 [Treponema sp.]|jgi:hypothetical protein|nr:hypothetical protein [Treponema sp.]
MRVFICSFGGFSVAIPMHSVASLSLNEKSSSYNDNPESSKYISLPQLFNLPAGAASHCVILKETGKNTAESRTVLLTTEIEYETEIPDIMIYPVPKTLNVMRFYALFSGILFISGLTDKRIRQRSMSLNDSDDCGDVPLLLLNPEYFA